MKTAERHRLKTNEFAETLAAVGDFWTTNRQRLLTGALALLLLVAGIGGFSWWRGQRAAAAAAGLSQAMSMAQAQILSSPQAPAGSFPTEAARDEAMLKKLAEVAGAYAGTPAGLTARYEAAALLSRLGREAEAQREFQAVADRAGSSLYGRMAQLGIADLQVRAGRFEPAITTFRELAARADTDMPADGILMHLARAYLLAGKRAEALQTFTRVYEQHPDSIYAADARREADALKAGAAAQS
jgi:predicted negative regulator of RcsB-dependent stress response